MLTRIQNLTVGLIVAVPVTACSRVEPQKAYADSLPAKTAASETSAAAPAVRLALSPTGNVVRYRVREQLMHHDLPNDAVGETKAVTGSLEIDSAGKVIAQSSKFAADAATFVSDQNRRDGYVRSRLLDSNQYPSIVRHPPHQLEGHGEVSGRKSHGLGRDRIYLRRHSAAAAEGAGPAQRGGHHSIGDGFRPDPEVTPVNGGHVLTGQRPGSLALVYWLRGLQ
jgi:hypothetical protein